jgi:DNA-directed RNA polymerase subunit RPC12/RpoP
MRSTTLSIPQAGGSVYSKISCFLMGHQAANRCDCRTHAFAEDGTLRHIRHVLSCFLGGHCFTWLVSREAHHEYVCHSCGHQLLLKIDQPKVVGMSLWRRPRYFCSLFGHRVRRIGNRLGLSEYVCGCGHSFMKRQANLKKIKHPLTCTLLGHFVRFLVRRDGYAEYLCQVCGHTFCYRSIL